MRKGFILGVLGLYLLASCENSVYTERREISSTTWDYSDSLIFEFSPPDTQSLYNIELTVEHSKDFDYQNLYMRLHTIFPNQDTLKQPFSIDLSDKFGQWLGDCSSTSCERSSLLQAQTRFEYLGLYTLLFEQFSRYDSLAGINALEIDIYPVEK